MTIQTIWIEEKVDIPEGWEFLYYGIPKKRESFIFKTHPGIHTAIEDFINDKHIIIRRKL